MLATLLFYHMMQYYVSLCTIVNFNLLFSYSAIQPQTCLKYQSVLPTVALLALKFKSRIRLHRTAVYLGMSSSFGKNFLFKN